METNILLESGTNELEILEFVVQGNHYGINVAKVKEILSYQEISPVPNAHPWVEGAFMPRGEVITVINLKRCLRVENPKEAKGDMLIVTNFNESDMAFHVNEIVGIHRISWTEIKKPDPLIAGAEDSIATGILRMEDRLIVILDFEKIVASVNPDCGIRIDDLKELGPRGKNTIPLLFAEDSMLLTKMLEEALNKAGYTNYRAMNNGLETWNQLQKWKEEGTVFEHVACVITDIEMPQMDGHHLLKLMKEDEDLKKIPVIIFSSLINDEIRIKGESLGADAQVSKSDINGLIKELDRILK